jgi:hypothetical protein
MLCGGCVIDLDQLTADHVRACIKYLKDGLLPVLEKLKTSVKDCVSGFEDRGLDIQLRAMETMMSLICDHLKSGLRLPVATSETNEGPFFHRVGFFTTSSSYRPIDFQTYSARPTIKDMLLLANKSDEDVKIMVLSLRMNMNQRKVSGWLAKFAKGNVTEEAEVLSTMMRECKCDENQLAKLFKTCGFARLAELNVIKLAEVMNSLKAECECDVEQLITLFGTYSFLFSLPSFLP